MTDPHGPWGIIVTRTLHMCPPNSIDRPACFNAVVTEAMEQLRDVYRSGERNVPPIFGYAEHRPVCRHCVRAIGRTIVRLQEQLDEAECWEGKP